MKEIVLATGNLHKVGEISAILAPIGLTVLPQSRFGVTSAEETGTTFVENAIIKARNAAVQTGLPAMADDSGIEVDALLGQPGIYSSRYAGEEGNDQKNLEKLLEAMREVEAPRRTCRYWCVMVFMRHAKDPTPVICQASWEGSLATTPRGTGGFGYDPVFLLPEGDLTAAELSPERKNQLSHRGKALRMMFDRLRELI